MRNADDRRRLFTGSSTKAVTRRPRVLITAGAALGALLLALACGTSSVPAATDDGTTRDPNEDACRSPQEGCPCEAEGSQVDCGKVNQQTGTFVECAYGKRACIGGRWGECVAEGLTKTKSLTSSLSTLGLAQDAGSCAGNPCDPYCSSYADTPPGLELPADGGLLVTDAGLTLAPQVPAGANCTSLTIAASATSMTVTQLSPLTSTPPAITFTATFAPAGCATAGTQPTWVLDKPTIATISPTGSFTVADGVAGPIAVRAFFATSSTVLESTS